MKCSHGSKVNACLLTLVCMSNLDGHTKAHSPGRSDIGLHATHLYMALRLELLAGCSYMYPICSYVPSPILVATIVDCSSTLQITMHN